MRLKMEDLHAEAGKNTYWVVNWTEKKLLMIAHPDDSNVRPIGEINQKLTFDMKDFMGLKRFPEVKKHIKVKQKYKVFPYLYNGQTFWIKSCITITHYKFDTIISGVTGIIKEHAPPMEQYRELLKNHFSYIKHLQIPAMIVNCDGGLLLANAKYNTELKKRAARSFGINISTVFKPQVKDVSFVLKKPQNYTAVFTDKEKNEQHYHLTSAPFKFGKATYHVLYAVNMSQEVRIATAFNDLNAQINQLRTLKNNLLSTTTHDLKAPINRILGLAKILDSEVQDQEQLEYVGLIKNCAQSLYSTAQGMLEADKDEENQLSVLTPVDIKNILKEITPQIARKAEKKGLEFIYREMPVKSKIKGNEFLVKECINIATDLAIETTASGKIIIELSEPTKYEINISVLDNAKKSPELIKDLSTETRRRKSLIKTEELSLGMVVKYLDFMGGEIQVNRRKSGENAVYMRFDKTSS
ncbi:MAG: sensor histidine kinase [Flavobacteriales bacterium]